MMIQAHLIFKGRVQGVGFRRAVFRCASIFSLKGTVKNLDDGSVEVYIEGKKEEIEAFIARVRAEARSARIDEVMMSQEDSKKKFTSFTILDD